MKKLLPIIFCLFSFVRGSAQVVFLDTTDINALKKTTTLFVLPQEDSILRAKYELAIRSTWTATPFKIISVEELKQYAGRVGYSFFCEIFMGDHQLDRTLRWGTSWPRRWVPYRGDKDMDLQYTVGWEPGKRSAESSVLGFPKEKGIYGFFSLFITNPSNPNRGTVRYADIKIGAADESDAVDPVYKKNTKLDKSDPYWNPYWNPGLLTTYLRMINNALNGASVAPGSFYPFCNNEDTGEVNNLIHDTLYIPDYVEFARDRSRQSRRKHFITDNEIDHAYSCPFRILTSQQLSDLILNTHDPVTFLSYQAFYPALMRYDEKNKELVMKNGFAMPGAPGSYTEKGIKIYNAEKGAILVYYPKPVYWTSTNEMDFSEEDLTTLVEAIKTRKTQ